MKDVVAGRVHVMIFLWHKKEINTKKEETKAKLEELDIWRFKVFSLIIRSQAPLLVFYTF